MAPDSAGSAGLGHGYEPIPSEPGSKPCDANDDDAMDQDDDSIEGKEDKTSGLDFGALERDLLEYHWRRW